MGNSESLPVKQKLSAILPHGDTWSFASDDDRTQFIHAIITVITQNGQIDLQNHKFRLLYSRKANDRIVARIVAMKDGVITAKTEPESDGEDQTEAFKALRKDIEMRLEHILASVPLEPVASGSSTGSIRQVRVGNGMVEPSDMPPAYGSGEVKYSRKK